MSGQLEWTSKDKRDVLWLTHGFPFLVLVCGLSVSLLILWSGNATIAGGVATATLTVTGVLSRQGRLAAPAAIGGVGIAKAPPTNADEVTVRPETVDGQAAETS